MPRAASILISAAALKAENHNETLDTSRSQSAGLLFRGHELSLDLFGSLSVGQTTIDDFSGDRVKDEGRMGAAFAQAR